MNLTAYEWLEKRREALAATHEVCQTRPILRLRAHTDNVAWVDDDGRVQVRAIQGFTLDQARVLRDWLDDILTEARD